MHLPVCTGFKTFFFFFFGFTNKSMIFQLECVCVCVFHVKFKCPTDSELLTLTGANVALISLEEIAPAVV